MITDFFASDRSRPRIATPPDAGPTPDEITAGGEGHSAPAPDDVPDGVTLSLDEPAVYAAPGPMMPAPKPVEHPGEHRTQVAGRLVATTVTLGPGDTTVLMGGDPLRSQLALHATGPGVMVASADMTVTSPVTSLLVPADTSVTLPYRGPLYGHLPAAAAGPVTVTVWALTDPR